MFIELMMMLFDTPSWSNSKRLEKECPNYKQFKQGSSKFFRPFIELR